MTLPAEKLAFTGLTASDFAAAAGVNPYQSRAALWRRLTGRETFAGNEATRWGQEHESDAIAAYEAWSGLIVEDCGEAQRFRVLGEYGCTVDGRADGRIVECKAPVSVYEDVKPYHYPQIMGALHIHKVTECDYTVWMPEETRIWRVLYVPAYWRWLAPLLDEFMGYMESDQAPPRLGRRPVPPDVSAERLL